MTAVLPTPEALRTILDVTVHAGECEKVLRAYAEGRLIDGQAIADAWNAYREDGGSRYSEAMDNFVGVIMNIVEDNDAN